MGSEVLLKFHEDEEEEEELKLTRIERRNEMQSLNLDLNHHMKSYEILKSAVKNITSNTKFMFFMILSIVPLFAFMIFFEMKIPEVKDLISELLVPPLGSYIMYDFDGNDLITYDVNDARRRVFRVVFELFPLYLILLPLLEFFSSTIIINIAAKIYTGNMESGNIKETFCQKNKLKGYFKTCLWVQLFSVSTLFGLIWAVVNHYIVTNGFDYDSVSQKGLIINFMSIGFHAMIFLALLNKYLDWSVSWNMGMVISVLEGETGIDALELSAYYGKHCKQTGFRLMLIFFVYSVALRIPFVLVRMCNYVSVRIVVTVGLVCLGSLVKWVALVLYFYDCKAQVWLKKDDEVGEAVKTDDLC